jgi:hypothetical protein
MSLANCKLSRGGTPKEGRERAGAPAKRSGVRDSNVFSRARTSAVGSREGLDVSERGLLGEDSREPRLALGIRAYDVGMGIPSQLSSASIPLSDVAVHSVLRDLRLLDCSTFVGICCTRLSDRMGHDRAHIVRSLCSNLNSRRYDLFAFDMLPFSRRLSA